MKVNQLKAGAILSYISMGIGFLVSMVYTPVMLRILGKSEYGLYNLVSSIVSYLALLSFGFGSAYVRFYSRYKVKQDEGGIARLNGMYMIIFLAIGFIALLSGAFLTVRLELILGDQITPDEYKIAKILMAVLVLNIATTFPMSVFSSFVIANERFYFQKLLVLLKTIANPFLMLAVLLLGFRSIGLVVITFVLNTTIELIQAYYCLRKLNMHFQFTQFDRGLMKDLTVFSSYIFISMLIDQLNWNIAKFLLGRFRGTASVAVFGVAATINTQYIHLSTAVSNVFVPRVNQMVAREESNRSLSTLFTRVGRIQFMVLAMIGMGFIFFGSPFVKLWAGKEYAAAHYIILLLILPVTVPLIQNLGLEIQKAKNLHKFRSIVYLLIALVNIAISIPLIIQYGEIGAAIGTSGSLLLGNGIVMNWYYYKKVGLDIPGFWKSIAGFIPALAVTAAVGIAINMLVDLHTPRNLILFGGLFAMVYLASLWLLGMRKDEKQLVLVLVNKMKRRFTKIG